MLLRKIATIACLTLSSFALSHAAEAVNFGHEEIDPRKIVAIASPYGEGKHQLLIVEQISAGRLCWSEIGTDTKLIIIDPRLRDFDFTGICQRSTDANGYSVRMGGRDLGWRYGLRIVERDGDMLLVAASTTKREARRLIVGRLKGVTEGFAKIQLEPGWRMTHRSFNGQVTGHVYLTHDRPLAEVEQDSASILQP